MKTSSSILEDCRSYPLTGLREMETWLHTLAKHARNLINDVFWIEDNPPPTEDALYYDSLHINE